MSNELFRNGCWDCKRAIEDPNEKYICSKAQQHLMEYEKYMNNKELSFNLVKKKDNEEVRFLISVRSVFWKQLVLK